MGSLFQKPICTVVASAGDAGQWDVCLLISGLMIAVTVVYFLLRRFIVWAVKDENKWHKKQGHLGMSASETKNKIKLACDRLTCGYALFMFALSVLMVVQIAS